MGPDKIPPVLLKLALPFIIEPLTYSYNLCITQSTIPTSLKTAKVIPIPKTKDPTRPGDFRPISLLPIIAKPLEKHINTFLIKYMEKYKLFHEKTIWTLSKPFLQYCFNFLMHFLVNLYSKSLSNWCYLSRFSESF